ncbi:hypothetical protein HAX54_030364 [Datura stramonium]|uniref:Uncharacterized protein n=1 Tax=Datura stramonium TaxID=4076 RepID=A0ABS8RKZ7_DATST|nr:hypothetical protein [Datura stramonium]
MEMQPHMHIDPFEDLEMAEKSVERHRRSVAEMEASENSGAMDLRHFALYALVEHNYKRDVHALNNRHLGDFGCREFRESILGVMPHNWDRREKTKLKLAHFSRHKRKAVKKLEEKHPPGKDTTKRISNVIGNAVNYAKSAKHKKPSPYIPTITNHTQLWWVPNVVVAHEKDGIEAVHIATGCIVYKFHLLEGGLHGVINGNKALDHVEVVRANGVEQTVVSGSMEVLRPCWAVATSGVPIREQLFNASICRHSLFNLFQHGEFSRGFGQTFDASSLEVATPILIPRNEGHPHLGSRSTLQLGLGVKGVLE